MGQLRLALFFWDFGIVLLHSVSGYMLKYSPISAPKITMTTLTRVERRFMRILRVLWRVI